MEGGRSGGSSRERCDEEGGDVRDAQKNRKNDKEGKGGETYKAKEEEGLANNEARTILKWKPKLTEWGQRARKDNGGYIDEGRWTRE